MSDGRNADGGPESRSALAMAAFGAAMGAPVDQGLDRSDRAGLEVCANVPPHLPSGYEGPSHVGPLILTISKTCAIFTGLKVFTTFAGSLSTGQ